MKFKYYLRGVGIGVVVTTVILVIAFSLTGKNISDDDVIKRAKKLGMVMSEDENTTVSEDKEKKDESKSDDSALNDSNESDDSDTKETLDEVEIVVNAGDNPRKVINALLDAGVIDDYDTFSEYLYSNHLDGLVYPGTYKVNKDMSMEEIADLLTTKD